MPNTDCLVVDDSDVIRSVTIRMLSGMPMTTREATNGRDALLSCAARMPDVVV